MLFQYNVYFVFLSITATISAIVGFAAWQQRSISPASKPFILMMLAIAFYATVAAMEAVVITIREKIFWSKLEYVGSGSVITLFLIFVMQLTNKNRCLTPRNTALLWVIPTLNVVLVATNEWHGLVWSGFLPDPQGTHAVIYQHSLGFFWIMACIYVYTLTGVVMLIHKALLPSVLYRRQSTIVLVGAALPLLGASLYMLRLTPPGLNITPMCFMLTGLCSFVSVFRLRILELVPIARDTVIEMMSDGVLVLDVKNRIIDINPAAKRLIGAKEQHIGQSPAQVLAKWPEIAKMYHAHESLKMEIFIDAVTPCYVELLITPLHDERKRLTGRLLVLRDITQRYQAESELRQANERLQKQVIEIETLQAELRERAIRDGLTGLFNRRYFDDIFPKELTKAARDSAPVVLIIMDIDYFKKINDTFGHQAGDRVIQAFANLLGYYSHPEAIVCRYGGEEFVLALPGMTLENGFQHAEQIRLSFQAVLLEFAGKEIYSTVSGGVGVFPDHGKTRDELLQVVDQALYAAKLNGRNCIKYVQSHSSELGSQATGR
ncbi:histidine kinase N-terminal 7TM domain-containing protein [Calothrix sp. PCC 7507]|uniref:histidine kinase N-terminal 7TM domain-containing diguanylate cyclase n=1 Tax=Calothrix sp. PCC 7507 TaxID=99598 RepID=UPI00029ED5F3|nr:histidine kinase N-terminal 7TM domain-containing protein [Calothrix sp. PCC 7507]AFY30562.1 diguanylate cyclase with PAS/PAC sensor [Calothrix sp. PCC 7507]